MPWWTSIRELEKERESSKGTSGLPIKKLGSGLLFFTDAIFNYEDVSCTFGAIIADAKGHLRDYMASALGKVESPLEAELLAIREGLKGIQGWDGYVVMFADCQEVVNAINEKEQFWNRSGYTLEWIKEELCRKVSWRCFHFPRIYNEAAYWFASSVRTPTNSPYWIGTRVKDWLQELGSRLFCKRKGLCSCTTKKNIYINHNLSHCTA